MQLKTVPEDFIVVEVAKHDVKEEGPYALIELTKRGLSTEKVLSEIADSLGVPRRFLGYAGAKDARALTKQYITVKIERSDVLERLKRFKRNGIVIRFVGFLDEPLRLGMLERNRFEIVVRKLGDEALVERNKVPNYFDEQRFSVANAEIGKLLIKGDFAGAARRIIETDSEVAPRMQEHLSLKPNDAITALRHVPRNILLMYVHSYQSLLWNEVLTAHIKRSDPAAVDVDGPVPIAVPSIDLPDVSIPLFGFGTQSDPAFASLYETILAREGLVPRDFVVRSLPFLTVEGDERDAFFPVEDLEIGLREPDDIHQGSEKQRLTFTLPKGCYATMVVKVLYRVGRVQGER
jgi:tRNA pseudouridine13 synthase